MGYKKERNIGRKEMPEEPEELPGQTAKLQPTAIMGSTRHGWVEPSCSPDRPVGSTQITYISPKGLAGQHGEGKLARGEESIAERSQERASLPQVFAVAKAEPAPVAEIRKKHARLRVALDGRCQCRHGQRHAHHDGSRASLPP